MFVSVKVREKYDATVERRDFVEVCTGESVKEIASLLDSVSVLS